MFFFFFFWCYCKIEKCKYEVQSCFGMQAMLINISKTQNKMIYISDSTLMRTKWENKLNYLENFNCRLRNDDLIQEA